VSREKLTEVALGVSIDTLKWKLAAGDFLSLNSVANAGKPFVGAVVFRGHSAT
jgi:hypothetical protein